MYFCASCREEGHTESACPHGLRCYTCLRSDHLAWQCLNNPVPSSESFTAGVVCQTCGSVGHLSLSCKAIGGAAWGRPGAYPRSELLHPLVLRHFNAEEFAIRPQRQSLKFIRDRKVRCGSKQRPENSSTPRPEVAPSPLLLLLANRIRATPMEATQIHCEGSSVASAHRDSAKDVATTQRARNKPMCSRSSQDAAVQRLVDLQRLEELTHSGTSFPVCYGRGPNKIWDTFERRTHSEALASLGGHGSSTGFLTPATEAYVPVGGDIECCPRGSEIRLGSSVPSKDQTVDEDVDTKEDATSSNKMRSGTQKTDTKRDDKFSETVQMLPHPPVSSRAASPGILRSGALSSPLTERDKGVLLGKSGRICTWLPEAHQLKPHRNTFRENEIRASHLRVMRARMSTQNTVPVRALATARVHTSNRTTPWQPRASTQKEVEGVMKREHIREGGSLQDQHHSGESAHHYATPLACKLIQFKLLSKKRDVSSSNVEEDDRCKGLSGDDSVDSSEPSDYVSDSFPGVLHDSRKIKKRLIRNFPAYPWHNIRYPWDSEWNREVPSGSPSPAQTGSFCSRNAHADDTESEDSAPTRTSQQRRSDAPYGVSPNGGVDFYKHAEPITNWLAYTIQKSWYEHGGSAPVSKCSSQGEKTKKRGIAPVMDRNNSFQLRKLLENTTQGLCSDSCEDVAFMIQKYFLEASLPQLQELERELNFRDSCRRGLLLSQQPLSTQGKPPQFESGDRLRIQLLHRLLSIMESTRKCHPRKNVRNVWIALHTSSTTQHDIVLFYQEVRRHLTSIGIPIEKDTCLLLNTLREVLLLPSSYPGLSILRVALERLAHHSSTMSHSSRTSAPVPLTCPTVPPGTWNRAKPRRSTLRSSSGASLVHVSAVPGTVNRGGGGTLARSGSTVGTAITLTSNYPSLQLTLECKHVRRFLELFCEVWERGGRPTHLLRAHDMLRD